jgi:hypothetical protein
VFDAIRERVVAQKAKLGPLETDDQQLAAEANCPVRDSRSR